MENNQKRKKTRRESVVIRMGVMLKYTYATCMVYATKTNKQKAHVNMVTAPPSQLQNTSEISKYNQDALTRTAHLKDCKCNHANNKTT